MRSANAGLAINASAASVQPFCNSNADCPGIGRECIQVDSSDTGNPPIPADFVCTAGCDPINPSAICGTGVTCDFYDTTFTQCFGPVGFGVGANGCTQDNPLLCARGYICLLRQQLRRNGAGSTATIAEPRHMTCLDLRRLAQWRRIRLLRLSESGRRKPLSRMRERGGPFRLLEVQGAVFGLAMQYGESVGIPLVRLIGETCLASGTSQLLG